MITIELWAYSDPRTMALVDFFEFLNDFLIEFWINIDMEEFNEPNNLNYWWDDHTFLNIQLQFLCATHNLIHIFLTTNYYRAQYSADMPTIYSLDDTIKEFFESNSAVTRQQCDELAITLVGEPINPSPIQGAFSYTVIVGAKQSKVVQFRTQTSILNSYGRHETCSSDLWTIRAGLYLSRTDWTILTTLSICDRKASRSYLYRSTL